MALTEFGIWVTRNRLGEEGGEAARLVEELGFGALWVGGSPRLSDLRPLLEATETLTVATSIANVWRYGAAEMAAEWPALERDFPGRALAGIGAGHPEQDSDYGHPFSAVREYLDLLDESGGPPPERRLLAALAPRMLGLSASRATGAIPYFVPVGHTRFARERLGEGPLLAPELAFVLDQEPQRAQAKARGFAELYLGLANYRNAVLRGGFDEEDLEGGGSEAMLDAVVPQGSAERIAAVAREHLEAGADHVALQAAGVEGVPRAEWTALAAALIA